VPDAPRSVVQAATRSSVDAPFSAPASLSGPDASDPAAAISPAGQAVVVWNSSVLEGTIIQQVRVAVRSADLLPDGSWSAPAQVGAPDGPTPYSMTTCGFFPPSDRPRVAMDGLGDAVAVWLHRQPDGTAGVQWSVHPAGGHWGPAADLTSPGGNPLGLELAVDSAGDALTTWLDSSGLAAARRPAGGGFGPVERIAPSAVFPGAALAIDELGRGLAVWVQHGSADQPDRVMASARPAAGGGWTAPEDLSTIAEPPPVVVPPEPTRRDAIPPPPVTPVPPVRLSQLQLLGRPRAIVSFRLTAPARVRITLQHGGRGAALRSVTIGGRSDLNRVRIPRRGALGPGRYVIVIRAVDAGGRVVLRAGQLTV